MVKEISVLTPEIYKELDKVVYDMVVDRIKSRWSASESISIEGVLWFIKARGFNLEVLPESADKKERVHALFQPLCRLVKAVVSMQTEEGFPLFANSISAEEIEKMAIKVGVKYDHYIREAIEVARNPRLFATYSICDQILDKVITLPEENSLFFCKYADYINRWQINEPAALTLYYGSIVRQYFALDLDEESFLILQPSLVQCMSHFIGESAKGDLFDPFCNIASTSMISKTAGGKYYGCELSQDAYRIGCLLASLQGTDISNVKPSLGNYAFNSCQLYDTIASVPPFGLMIPGEGGRNFPSSVWFIENSIRHLRDLGTAVGIFPVNLISSEARPFRELRKNITDNNLLDSVVVLPSKLFKRTVIATALIVIKKNREANASIRIIDASSFYRTNESYRMNDFLVEDFLHAIEKSPSDISTLVSRQDISEADYLWVPNAFSSINKEVPEGYNRMRLKDFAKVEKMPTVRVVDGPCVIQSNLKTDKFDNLLDIDNLSNHSNRKTGFYKLSHSAILVSSMLPLRPTICKASTESPVFVSREIFAISVDAEIVTDSYFSTLLSDLPASVFKGAMINRVSVSELLNLSFDIPFLNSQQALYNEAKKSYQIHKAEESGLIGLIDQMKSDYMNEVRSRKHDMKPHIRQIMSACKNMSIYLERKSEFSSEEFNDFMREELLAQEKAIRTLDSLLNIFSRESKFGDPEVVNIDGFLKEYIHSCDDYKCSHEVDYQALSDHGYVIPKNLLNDKHNNESVSSLIEGLNVYVAKDDLIRLFSNLVENAKQHAFPGQPKELNHISTKLSVDHERDMFKIEVINSGNPFPEGMDKLHYGIRGEKAGEYAGTGEGGYIVKSIVEHYNGDFEIGSSKYFYFYFYDEDGCPTNDANVTLGSSVIIYLPIHHGDE